MSLSSGDLRHPQEGQARINLSQEPLTDVTAGPHQTPTLAQREFGVLGFTGARLSLVPLKEQNK